MSVLLLFDLVEARFRFNDVGFESVQLIQRQQGSNTIADAGCQGCGGAAPTLPKDIDFQIPQGSIPSFEAGQFSNRFVYLRNRV